MTERERRLRERIDVLTDERDRARILAARRGEQRDRYRTRCHDLALSRGVWKERAQQGIRKRLRRVA